jgi:type IV pilus assembly protein PilC
VALYFRKQHAFNKNIRAVLAMPMLTLLFFVAISFFIFNFIIPRFADMFNSLQQELPTLTRTLIRMSEFSRSITMMYILAFCGIVTLILYRYFSTSGKKLWNSIVDCIPFIGKIVWQHHMCQALQALSLLVVSGVSLVEAIKIVSASIGHDGVKVQLVQVHDKVESGELLSNAMDEVSVFLPEVVAIIRVGEESGTLGHSLDGAALVYTTIVEEALRRFIFFLQPVVIIILGVMITILIFAVYLPVMQLSHVL